MATFDPNPDEFDPWTAREGRNTKTRVQATQGWLIKMANNSQFLKELAALAKPQFESGWEDDDFKEHFSKHDKGNIDAVRSDLWSAVHINYKSTVALTPSVIGIDNDHHLFRAEMLNDGFFTGGTAELSAFNRPRQLDKVPSDLTFRAKLGWSDAYTDFQDFRFGWDASASLLTVSSQDALYITRTATHNVNQVRFVAMKNGLSTGFNVTVPGGVDAWAEYRIAYDGTSAKLFIDGIEAVEINQDIPDDVLLYPKFYMREINGNVADRATKFYVDYVRQRQLTQPVSTY